MFTKYLLLDILSFAVLGRQQIPQFQETFLVFRFIVVTELDLDPDGGQLHGRLERDLVGAVNNTRVVLDVHKVQLDRIVTVNVDVGKEEFLSEEQHLLVRDTLEEGWVKMRC